jgi:hypothetical protein
MGCSAVVSCEGELIISHEIEFYVLLYLITSAHTFDSEIV